MKKKSVKHFFSLSFLRKALYLEAVFFLLVWHILSKILPLSWYKRFFGKRTNETSTPVDPLPSPIALKISYVVNLSAQLVPWKPVCYPQALAAKSMLQIRGLDSLLYFGAKGDNQKLIKLHCWINHRGHILTGKRGHKSYTVIQIYQ